MKNDGKKLIVPPTLTASSAYLWMNDKKTFGCIYLPDGRTRTLYFCSKERAFSFLAQIKLQGNLTPIELDVVESMLDQCDLPLYDDNVPRAFAQMVQAIDETEAQEKRAQQLEQPLEPEEEEGAAEAPQKPEWKM